MGNWLELKSDVSARLRASLVAVLTMALLLGPCLSISGLAGTGDMHGHAPQAMADAHDHMAAGHAGHSAAIDSDTGTKAPPGCEEMCDGWAVKSSKPDFSKSGLAAQGRVDAPDDNPAGVLFANRQTTGPPVHSQGIRLPEAQDTWLARIPGYALTGRYRL